MATQQDSWSHLSSRAAEMLATCNPNFQAKVTTEEARTFLQDQGCPAFPSFEKHITSYAGLRLAFSRSTVRVKCEFLNTDSGLQCICNVAGQWRLLICESDETHQGLWLRPDGSIYTAFYSGQQYQQTISGSCEVLLEHYAMLWQHSSENYIIDSVSSSLRDGARGIAELMQLPEVLEASDQYIRWWSSPQMAVGSIPLMGRRFRVYASWSISDHDRGKQIISALTGLLEPHLGQMRGSAPYEQYLNSGDYMALLSHIDPQTSRPPAESFRTAARIGLRRLASVHGFPEPPDDDEAFQRYLEAGIPRSQSASADEVEYYTSIGLAAFGHRDRLSKIIEFMPKAGGSGWGESLWPVAFLSDLLPNQFVYSPLDNIDDFAAWFSANRDRLSWNARRGLYVTTDDPGV